MRGLHEISFLADAQVDGTKKDLSPKLVRCPSAMARAPVPGNRTGKRSLLDPLAHLKLAFHSFSLQVRPR